MRNAFKRLFDLVVAFCALVVLAPVFVILGIAVRLDSPGPVFYKAVRVGRGGRLFGMYKFRTMRDGNGPKVTARDDPRITPLGRLLRETKLNELPQLLNVLKGEMSLVGPRPEDPEFVARYTDEERELLNLRPGLTSPASLVYYDEEALLKYSTAAHSYLSEIMPTKLRLDLLYVRHRSFLLDLDVLFRTAVATLPLYRRAAVDVEEVLLGPIQRLVRRHLSWFVVDFAITLGAVTISGLLWRTQIVFDVGFGLSVLAAFELALVFSLVNRLFGVQRTAWDYASLTDAVELAASAGLATLLTVAGRWVALVPGLPWRMIVTAGLLALLGFVAVRYRARLAQTVGYRWARLRGDFSGRERVLVVGGGEAGRLLVWTLQNSPRGQAFEVVGIVDDDLRMRGVRIHNVRVLGSRKHIPQIVREHTISLIVFAIHQMAPDEQAALLDICRATPARLVVLPDVLGLLSELEGPLAPAAPGGMAAGQGAGEAAGEAAADGAACGAPPPPGVPRATVAQWLEELSALAADGHSAELERRLAALQAEVHAGAPAAPDPSGAGDGNGR